MLKVGFFQLNIKKFLDEIIMNVDDRMENNRKLMLTARRLREKYFLYAKKTQMVNAP